ncbi:MAG: hypothetical protein IT330_00155, partial [Anaerolineae bacterium]|nr:hypothetical protein [Anaerolineae bacterium]
MPFLLTGALASLSPDVAAICAGALLALWPGYALAGWAGWGRGLSRVQRAPLWFALSLLLALLPTLAVTGLHLTVRVFNALLLTLAAGLVLATGLRRWRQERSHPSPQPSPQWGEGARASQPSPPRGEGR